MLWTLVLRLLTPWKIKFRIYGLKVDLSNLLHWIWTCLHHLLWRLDGTAAQIAKTQKGETSCPAQVLRIVCINPYIFLASPTTFFTRHERFAPASIIDNKRVHLLSVNSRTATFTEVDRDILDTRKYPFMFYSQVAFATRLIVLPVKVFYNLVDKMDISDRKMIWLFHTTRCGSTAWVQAFNSIPNSAVFSEPSAMYYSTMYGDHGYSSAESFSKSKEYKRIATATIKTFLRNTPKGALAMWKGTTYDEHLIDVIAEYFPQHKMLATYRDCLPCLASLHKTFLNQPYIQYITEVLLYHDPDDYKWWFQMPNANGWTNGVDHNFCRKVIAEVRPRTGPEWHCFMWTAKFAAYLSAIERKVNLKGFKYDSLMENKRLTVTKVFEYLELDEHIDLAIESFKFDSQAGVAQVSKDTRTKGDGLEWCQDAGVVKRCNMILKAFGLPDLNSSCDLPKSNRLC